MIQGNNLTEMICDVLEAFENLKKCKNFNKRDTDLLKAMLKCKIPVDQAIEAVLYSKQMEEEIALEKRAS
jgi:hypothetical protein